MSSSIIATLLIFASMLVIFCSLFIGLVYLLLDKQASKRLVVALSVRITVSVLLFSFLILAVYLGWIMPAPPPL